jgi:glycosyltransferase involved in cell wall biosynthesis
MEGGANVLSEALATGLPIVASAIEGLIGTLGEDYPGLFPAGDTRMLTNLIRSAEEDDSFYELLRRRCADLRPLVEPSEERAAWAKLLADIR